MVLTPRNKKGIVEKIQGNFSGEVGKTTTD
jgi:hypothetical protein